MIYNPAHFQYRFKINNCKYQLTTFVYDNCDIFDLSWDILQLTEATYESFQLYMGIKKPNLRKRMMGIKRIELTELYNKKLTVIYINLALVLNNW